MISLKLNKNKKDNTPIQKVRKKNIEILEPYQYHFLASKSKIVILNQQRQEVSLFIDRDNCQSSFINSEQLKNIKAR